MYCYFYPGAYDGEIIIIFRFCDEKVIFFIYRPAIETTLPDNKHEQNPNFTKDRDHSFI